MYNRFAILSIMAAMCLMGETLSAQSSGAIDQLFASVDDGQIEQLSGNPDYSILNDDGHREKYSVSRLNPPGYFSTEDLSQSLFIPQIERRGVAQKSRSFVEEFLAEDEVAKDGSPEAELLKALAEFGEKSDDEQVEAFRKIFEAVLQEENRTEVQPEPILELSGVVLDETRTKSGRDFYELFYSEFDIPQRSGTVTIRIEERVIPGSGSLILIEVNQNEAFTVQLRPGTDHVEQAVQQAVKGVSELISRNNDNFAIY